MSEEYLTISEVAARLKVKPKTIRNKMALGVFKRGVHYFSPKGMKPRFKWSAVQTWLEEKDSEGQQEVIQMKKGTVLKIPLTDQIRQTIRAGNGL